MSTDDDRDDGPDDALEGADVFVGLSGPNLLSAEGLKRMAANPIVFACSNPDPEITPELAHLEGTAGLAPHHVPVRLSVASSTSRPMP